MLTAITADETKVIATLVEKNEGPFFCRECNSELRLKKGKIKIHHFAHIPPYSCSYGLGESKQHLKCKLKIYKDLSQRKNIDKLELERSLDGLRPDISFRVNKKQYVGIEIQISNLSLSEIKKRTIQYKKLGIYVCWILLMNKDIREEKMSPKSWEKWIHLLNFGRVYYWINYLRVMPVHFGNYLIDVPMTSWYSVEEGEELTGGGYQRISKRYKKAIIYDSIDLIDDFIGKNRKEYNASELSIPESKIWHDKLAKWW